jgi:hypothetical protein
MKYIKLFENFSDVEEFDITDIDEIDGKYCKDFKVKELKVGDKIFMRQIDIDDNEWQWAKDVNKFEPVGLAIKHSNINQYEVVEINDDVIKLKEHQK